MKTNSPSDSDLEVSPAKVSRAGYPSLKRAWRVLLGAAPIAMSPLSARADLTPPPTPSSTKTTEVQPIEHRPVEAAAHVEPRPEARPEPRLQGKMVAVNPPPAPKRPDGARVDMPNFAGGPTVVRLGGDMVVVEPPTAPKPKTKASPPTPARPGGEPMRVLPEPPPLPGGAMMVMPPAPPTRTKPQKDPEVKLLLLHPHELWEPCFPLQMKTKSDDQDA